MTLAGFLRDCARRTIPAAMIVAAMWASGPGRAYDLHGFSWDSESVKYSVTDERLDAYATESMGLWSRFSGLKLAPGGEDIRIIVAPLLPPLAYAGQPAQANVRQADGTIQNCEVRVDPDLFFALTDRVRQAVITHEIGHCLGLNHSKVPSIMQSPFLYGVTDDDAAAMSALYGEPQAVTLRFQAVVVALASDE